MKINHSRRAASCGRVLTRTLVLACLAGGPVAFSSTARAQEQEDELQEARVKFQRAIELEHAGNYGGALKLFRSVGQVKMTPQVRYHIATCEEKLGQLVAALGGYELALAQSEGLHPDFITDVQESVDDLKARIPKLIIQRGEGAEAAAIELDGVALGSTFIGVETPLNPGPHTVTATAPGYDDYRQTVTISEGQVETLVITLDMLEEGSKSEVAGAESGAGSGPHFGALPYIIGGAGLGIAVVGGVFLGLSQAKVGTLKSDDFCGSDFDCSDLQGADRTRAEKLNAGAHTFETIGWVGVGIGVAALATGTVLWVLDKGPPEKGPPPEAETARVSFQPSAPRSDFGMSFIGSF